MDLLALLASYGGWAWVVGGIVLLAIELVAPGGVFVWLGAAAILTGIAALIQPISGPFQWVLFGVLSILSVAAWLNYSRRRQPEESERPLLNQRAQRLVGETAVLQEPIADGRGRIELGGSVWQVRGPDLAAGQKIEVTGAQGSVLRVMPVAGEDLANPL